MFKRVRPYMGEYIKYTWAAVACCTAAIVLSVLPYFFIYQLILPLIEGRELGASVAAVWIGLSALCMALHGLLYVKGLEFSHICAFNTLKNLRFALQAKVEAQPLGAIREIGGGRLKQVFTDDIEMIELLLAHAIPEGLANLMIPFFVILAMLVVDWRLALLAVLTLPIGLFAMGMMMKLGYARMNDFYAAGAKMNNTIVEYVNGMEVVKIFNKDVESYARYERDVMGYRDFTLDWFKVCWPWMALYSAILPCLGLFLLPAGGRMVLGGGATLADFTLVVCMSFAVGGPILKALSFAGKIPQLNYKIEELERRMSHPPLKQSDRGFEGANHAVRFEDVHFSYGDAEVIRGVTLSLEEGATTALVGESGSGKSTLAKLLVHFYDLDSGRITLGGQDIADMRIEALNERIAFVSQEQFLFNVSLYDNILLGRPSASREEVLEAARRAQCDEFLARLPQGIDSPAGDCGKLLSGGERQRVALARALLKDAPVIVLDEATAFIDPENEEKMNAALAEVIRNKTVLVIAHRLGTITGADKICVLKEGRLEAEGRHAELLESSPEYARLFRAAEEAAAWTIDVTEKTGEVSA